MPVHKVAQGETTTGIAEKYGMSWSKIWNHGDNAALKRDRESPDILHPGDSLTIPPKEARTESAATDQRHRFRRNGIPAKLRLKVLDFTQPRANQDYQLEVDGALYEGTTDGAGMLEHDIPPDASKALLRFPDDGSEMELSIGHLDPIKETSGAQKRLNNLGYRCGVDGTIDAATQQAIAEFQVDNGLEETGRLDDATLASLDAAAVI